MAEREDKNIDQSLSYMQMLKAGFAGDSQAQLAKKRQYMQENQRPAPQTESPEAQAIRLRRLEAMKAANK